MVAFRYERLVFSMKPQLMVPVSVPLVPEIQSQLSPEVTAAVHGMVPLPVFETLNVVESAYLGTERLVGEITK